MQTKSGLWTVDVDRVLISLGHLASLFPCSALRQRRKTGGWLEPQLEIPDEEVSGAHLGHTNALLLSLQEQEMSPAVLYGVLVGVRSEDEDREQGRLLRGRCMERRVVSLVFFK